MEFGWIPPGIRSDSSRIEIQVDPSDSGGNGGNLVGMNPSPGQIWVGFH